MCLSWVHDYFKMRKAKRLLDRLKYLAPLMRNCLEQAVSLDKVKEVLSLATHLDFKMKVHSDLEIYEWMLVEQELIDQNIQTELSRPQTNFMFLTGLVEKAEGLKYESKWVQKARKTTESGISVQKTLEMLEKAVNSFLEYD